MLRTRCYAQCAPRTRNGKPKGQGAPEPQKRDSLNSLAAAPDAGGLQPQAPQIHCYWFGGPWNGAVFAARQLNGDENPFDTSLASVQMSFRAPMSKPTASMRNFGGFLIGKVPVEQLPDRIGVTQEIRQLKEFMADWVGTVSKEVEHLVRWQLLSRPKYFRPLTIFSCHRAVSDKPVSKKLLRSAAALEIFHNVSLIIDDILDRSRFRRERLTLHCRFGELPALMASGYLTAGGFALVEGDSYSVRLLAELMQRLGVAECLQWRLRRFPLGVEDWRVIAGEDTGSMFEICARLGTRNDRLRKFGMLVGLLYHGCDDVGDVRGAMALGGGGEEDIRDGILTLPAAFAIRDVKVAAIFRSPSKKNYKILTESMFRVLPEAEEYLDRIAEDARTEALKNADHPGPLLALIQHTRALSRS
jgi:geranylgeranyl diphosphate synthase, type I